MNDPFLGVKNFFVGESSWSVPRSIPLSVCCSSSEHEETHRSGLNSSRLFPE